LRPIPSGDFYPLETILESSGQAWSYRAGNLPCTIKILEDSPGAKIEPPLADMIRSWPKQVEPETRKDSRILRVVSDKPEREAGNKLTTILAGEREKPVQLDLFPEPEPYEVTLLNMVDQSLCTRQ